MACRVSRISPSATASPSRTRTAATWPSPSARTSCSIFIDSTIASTAPARTLRPASTVIATDAAGERRSDFDHGAGAVIAGSGARV
jgi:hypothetical protein